jgi:hypothetical protein
LKIVIADLEPPKGANGVAPQITSSEGLSKLHLPIVSGVYFLFGNGKLKYIGQSENITKRVLSHGYENWDECFYLSENDPDKRVILETQMLKKYGFINSNAHGRRTRDHRGVFRKQD